MKPCPFCGSDDVKVDRHDTYWIYFGFCETCEAEGPPMSARQDFAADFGANEPSDEAIAEAKKISTQLWDMRRRDNG